MNEENKKEIEKMLNEKISELKEFMNDSNERVFTEKIKELKLEIEQLKMKKNEKPLIEENKNDRRKSREEDDDDGEDESENSTDDDDFDF